MFSLKNHCKMMMNYKLKIALIYAVMAFMSIHSIYAQTLSKKGRIYYFELEGVRQQINEDEFKLLMNENEEALQLFNQSRSLNKVGNILMFSGIPVTLSGVVYLALSNIGSTGSNDNSKWGLAGGALITGGLIAFTFGVVNKTNSDKQSQESIRIYNNSKNLSYQQENIDIKLLIQPGNVGLYCTF